MRHAVCLMAPPAPLYGVCLNPTRACYQIKPLEMSGTLDVIYGLMFVAANKKSHYGQKSTNVLSQILGLYIYLLYPY